MCFFKNQCFINILKNITLKRFCKYIFVLFFFFVFNQQGKSLHIIGGEVYYECLGGDSYRINMKVYRDCNGGGAEFDNPAPISIYLGDDLDTLNPFRQLDVSIVSSGPIQPNLNNPCLIPPSNVCVEQALYSTTVNLPFHPSGYHISYQRCCRNTTINNVFTPGDIGATYTCFITPQALQACNTSPEYNNFPPIVICQGENIDFDHSATDADGDSLVYRFCDPLTGGGNYGITAADQFLRNTTIGITPIPANVPPYTPVTFIPPAFSFDQPLGTTANLTLNSETGYLDGIPLVQGQFVVGICVEEYRNGQLLSFVRREFQFNVTNCERQITADVREDVLIGPREYVLNSCGENTITFINESSQLQFIEEYAWEFDLNNGTIFTSAATDPTVTFPDIGTYQGTLIVNPNSPQCSDTADIFVNIYPEIVSDFSYDFDMCSPTPVTYTDLSFSGAGPISTFFWDFDDGETSTEQNPVHLFTEAGTFDVSLTVTDENNCEATSVQTIDWYPESEIMIEPEEDIGCEPFTVTIINNSFPIAGYTTEWDLGDGNTSTEASPTHTYELPGQYTVYLKITSPIGCVSDQTFPNLITVESAPIASFDCAPEELSNFNSTVTFTDQSTDAIAWDWSFGDGETSNLTNPIYTYQDTGKFEVMLIVTHPTGCQDSITKIIDIEPKFTYFLPNAFTPNFDELNDGFLGAGDFFGIEQFKMTIWNRWGEQIFETDDPNIAWNGKKNNSGEDSQVGVYVYLVNLIGNRGKKFEYKGFVTLIR